MDKNSKDLGVACPGQGYIELNTHWALLGTLIIGLLLFLQSGASVAALNTPAAPLQRFSAQILEQQIERHGNYWRAHASATWTYRQGYFTEAAQQWSKLADQGYAPAQFRLGLMYDYGQGVGRSHNVAVYWYRQAAYQGHVHAMYVLGVAYAHGIGVAVNMRRALVWWRLAGLKGNADAQYNLGLLYSQGQGVDQDLSQAAMWWHKAAEQGDPVAQFNLGVMFSNGMGVIQDYSMAEVWLRRSAAQGHKDAIEILTTTERGSK
ncbi:MAG TPA: sel1 repeat family protein [Acidiferrobacteraceae bacterium]|nr:sel1 repeat family protein [Acidiferrobacteraceae bacterium]